MAHGLRVASVSVAAMSRRRRAPRRWTARFMLARTPLSVATDDQWPIPKRAVSSDATAFWSAAIAAASASAAIVRKPRTSDAQFEALCSRASKIRFPGAGPNDAHGTTRVWFTPGFEKSHTPPGKIVRRRCSSAGVNEA